MTEIAEQKYMPGKMNRLTIDHIEPHGAYLADLEGNQILLPTKWLPRKAKTGDIIEVFIYFDSEDRPIATIHKPLAQIGEIAFLQAADVNNVGAFLEWGPEKQLLVPFREQKARMEPGRRYLVYLYTDSETNRIAASAKIENFIDKEPVDYQEGQEVEIVLWDKTDLGFKAVIENKHQGLIYENEVFEWALQKIFFGQLPEKWQGPWDPTGKLYKTDDVNTREIIALVPLGILVIFLGVYPSPVLDLMTGSVTQFIELMKPFIQ